jgi:hypothetical protein
MRRQKGEKQIRDMAKMDFTPWRRSAFEEVLSSDDGRKAMHAALVNIRIGIGLMTLTKAKLVTFCREEPEAAKNVIECLGGSRDSLRAAIEILEGAEGRMLVACSVLALEEEKAA